MKILYLPYNTASMPAISVQALKEAGHDAKGLILQSSNTQSFRGLEVISYDKKNPLKFIQMAKWYARFIQLAMWADIIHWTGVFDLNLVRLCMPLLSRLKKVKMIDFLGSDIRNPEVEFLDNPYYKRAYAQGYEYAYESSAHSEMVQKLFADAKFIPVVLPGMGQYLKPELFPRSYRLMQRLIIREFEPAYPSVTQRKPIIVHSPSAPVCKGTAYVNAAIESLRATYDFEYIQLTGVPHAESIRIIKSCDIFIDQLILGSYGMACIEAMAYGKPVMVYVKEKELVQMPVGLPVVNTNPDTIRENLASLLANPDKRHSIGIESRKFAEVHHDVQVVIPELVRIYQIEKSILNS